MSITSDKMDEYRREIERLNECSFQYRDDVRLLEEENTRMKAVVAAAAFIPCKAGAVISKTEAERLQAAFTAYKEST